MKVITKMTGLRLLEEVVNNNLSCGTMIRHKRQDIALMSNPPQPVYEYYKYTAGDKRFHRCNENGKLGAKGQPSFMNYQTLYKEFEIIEEDKEIEKLEIYSDEKNFNEEIHFKNILKVSKNGECEVTEEISVIVDKINELVKVVNSIKKGN